MFWSQSSDHHEGSITYDARSYAQTHR